MANNRFNKQVTPKGYMMGGRAKKMGGGMMMMKRPMMKDGGNIKNLPKGLRKDTTTSGYGDAGRKRSVPGFLKDSKPKSPPLRTRPGQNPKGKNFLILERAPKKNPTRRKKMMGGGSLKPVDPQTQKGLSKLPTKVRNKMGYMQDGGKVKDKPGKNLTFGKTYHPITELAMKNAMLASFKTSGKKGFSFGKISDEHKKIKEKFFDKGVKPSEIQKLDKEFKARIDRAKTSARKTLANRPGMKSYRKKQRKAKAIDTGSEN